MHFDLQQLVQAAGYLGVFTIVFVESGLLVGFFFPGDSLLFTAGFLASQGFFNIYPLALGCFIAAVLGDSVGYMLGHKFGRQFFNKEDSLFFKSSHLRKAEEFYQKHGGKTIILARFMPVIRTFAPVVAGIGQMKYRSFIAYNLVGGLLWAAGVTAGGYFLGKLIPADLADRYLIIISLVIIVLSVSPGIYHTLKNPATRKKVFSLLRR